MTDNPGTMQIEAPVVFIGYGIKNKELKCDPFSQSDLKGKIVLSFSGFAGINDTLSANYKAIKGDKTFSARQLGKGKDRKCTSCRGSGSNTV